MRIEEVTTALDLALQASGFDHAHVVHKPWLLSDNGSSYVLGNLAEWLKDRGMKHSSSAPYHPKTLGKIECWHQILKNRVLLENYFLSGDLEAQIRAFIELQALTLTRASLTSYLPIFTSDVTKPF